jgi:predicted GNAT family acetyltransferase
MNIETHPKNIGFVATHNGKIMGEILYHKDQNNLVITTTYVNPHDRGQGIANHLLKAVVQLARANRQKIIPLCSFAHKVLQAEAYQDVLAMTSS